MTTPQRRPYKGSCHCGRITYIAYLTLPPHLVSSESGLGAGTMIRRCNCGTCQKMGILHVRFSDARADFMLLGPLVKEGDAFARHGGIKVGEEGVRDYMCNKGKTHWYFCANCGVRCFEFRGESEIVEIEIEGVKTKIWRPSEGFQEEEDAGDGYISINAITLDVGQEGLDLKEWHEKGWICYLNYLHGKGEDRLGEPFDGGMY